MLVGVAAVVVGVSISFASASSAGRSGQAAFPVAQLVALARGSADSLGAPHVAGALVVATGKNQAENWLEPGAVPPVHPNPRVWVIVIKGRFVCDSCSGPPGHHAPRGGSAQSIWLPGQGVSDFGLTRRVPPGLSKLGHVTKLSLTPPRVPQRDLMLEPGEGIGPVTLGSSLRRLNSRLGPALEPGEYVLGSSTVSVQAGRRTGIDRIAVTSPQVSVDGYRLGAGFTRLQQQLQGWRAKTCPNGANTLRNEAGGVSTILEFAGNRFNVAVLGVFPEEVCTPGFPANP